MCRKPGAAEAARPRLRLRLPKAEGRRQPHDLGRVSGQHFSATGEKKKAPNAEALGAGRSEAVAEHDAHEGEERDDRDGGENVFHAFHHCARFCFCAAANRFAASAGVIADDLAGCG